MSLTINRKYGFIKSTQPHPEDHLFASHLDITTLPPLVDLRPKCPAVYDQGQLGSCHDSDTEVLTDRGFIKFSELQGNERLATINPENSELSYEMPKRLIRFEYKGELICGKGKFIDFRVTPDHNMLVQKWNQSEKTLNSKYELIPAKDLGWYVGLLNRVIWNGEKPSETYTLYGVEHKQKPQREDLEISMRTWLKFLGIYLAEGTMLKRDQCKDRISYKIQLAATKEREKEFVRKILTDLQITFLELKDRFTFNSKRIYEALASLKLEGIKAKDKFVPKFVFNQSALNISAFLEGHFAGDGCLDGELRAHYTGSLVLANDLQTLAFLSGKESHMSIRAARTSMMADGRVICGTLDEHRVSVCEDKNLSIDKKDHITTEEYEGEVFCAEVETYHTLVTRRNNKILISGNCTANSIAGAIEFDQLKQQLPKVWIPSRLFIYYGERKIEGTISQDAGAEIRDGIKFVAANGVCPESLWTYSDDGIKFAQKPPNNCYQVALKNKIQSYQSVPINLPTVKQVLASGNLVCFGFNVYSGFESETVAKNGQLNIPVAGEQFLGGHAVSIVGYNDSWQRVIVRNSWGGSWGLAGYFTMPYGYLTGGNSDGPFCSDFWTIKSVFAGS